MAKIIEKYLSYKIVGILFNVYNNLGGEYQEKYYQRAVSKELRDNNLNFKEQVKIPLNFKGESIGRYFLNFLIEDKIILEIKASSQFFSRDIKQVLAYLKSNNINLGILANFGRKGLEYKRILSGKNL